ncbi:hypothetical protein TTHERM_00581570 (macronuclear) [Tetrahymena thermophila SB210]|uniref:Uncharacterized protein n=1 Tax=Tetrahymena thermophila (strain SB210) TaxID=312017 RepID=Q23QC9_TETTS|nr:hypothetical protein TTHERM_00581570 [Tetrahymena thermophila SB210]EAR98655.1 hypothetical protein TTHERM_00581570 [Tetrahymena thermophila SB210]|eukprot:XP_001018900.1 hypothetical protein TTHERM_00581570 [Tetrahymena thermophila SB210]
MIVYNNNQFRLLHSISQPFIACCDQIHTLDSQIEQKKHIANEEQSINQYYKCNSYDYHSQIIYEPEYFLNTQIPNEDNSSNQINQHSNLIDYNRSNPLDFNSNNMNQDESSQQQNCFNDQKEFLNNKNMHLCAKNQSNQQDDESKHAKPIQQTFQNGFEGEKRIQYYKYNGLELSFEQTEADYSSTIQKSDSNNNRFQLETAEENQSACVYQNQENRSKQTQNSLKNIVYAFLKHFKQLKDFKMGMELSRYQFSNLKKQLVKYMKQHSFNYSVVKYLITHKIYKLLLMDFLLNDSYEWLSKSKVMDKQNVQEKILFLKNCIIDQKHLEELINY